MIGFSVITHWKTGENGAPDRMGLRPVLASLVGANL